MKSAFKKLPANKHSLDLGLLFAVTLCAVLGTLLIFSITSSEVSLDVDRLSSTPSHGGQAQCHDESQNQGYELFHDPFLQNNKICVK